MKPENNSIWNIFSKKARQTCLISIIFSAANCWAQTDLSQSNGTAKNDSTATVGSQEDRNMMLDASASEKPRDIPIGLPGEAGGTLIMEDGMPVASTWSPLYPYVHWAGASSYGSISLMSLEETVLRSGVLGFSVDSHTVQGSDLTHGAVALKTNNDGLINFDANVNGRVAPRWYFTAGVYANLDPTSTHPKHTTFVNNTRIYKLGLTRRWERGEASLLYKLTVNRDGLFGCDRAPFIYNGDGSISRLNGFRLGRDSYMPEDHAFSYMDLETGKIVNTNFNDENRRYIHDMTFVLKNKLNNLWSLDARIHLTGTKDMAMMGFSEVGIDESTSNSNVTYSDGRPYTGLVQKRLAFAQHFDFFETLAQAELIRKAARHRTNLGVSYWFSYQYCKAANAYIAQTVESDPQRLLMNGEREWDYNSSANYGRGREHFVSLYAIDDWDVTPRLNLFYGLRTELFISNYRIAADNEGETANKRHPGFYVNDGKVSLSTLKRTKIDAIGVGRANYRLGKGSFLTGEYVLSRMQRRFDQFRFDTYPSEKPYVKHLFRFGGTYETNWLRASVMFSYIESLNIGSTQYFTKQINGVSETQGKNTTYDIGTKGITGDFNLLLGDFTMHLLATFQMPKYKNFSVPLTFSDGSKEVLDYNGKYVTGMSKVLLELDPAYNYGDWRLWLSVRFYSRQYASLVNNVYFKGHFETFAGIDWKASDRLLLQLSLVNLFNTSGANGSIASANTITDTSQLIGYKIAGTFIRPFTVGLSATYKF